MIDPFYNVSFRLYCPKCTEFCYKFYKKEKCKKCMKIIRRIDTRKPVFFEEREELKVTDHGYDYILGQIESMPVNPPSAEDYNVSDFSAWVEGFRACYDQITNLIRAIKESSCQR